MVIPTQEGVRNENLHLQNNKKSNVLIEPYMHKYVSKIKINKNLYKKLLFMKSFKI
jgi:hypothetical protein